MIIHLSQLIFTEKGKINKNDVIFCWGLTKQAYSLPCGEYDLYAGASL